MWSHSFTRIRPSRHQRALELHDLVVRPAPLLERRVALDALDQHAAVPAAIEGGHAAHAGELAVEAPEEVVALFVPRRRREARHPVVPGIEWFDQALEGPTLAARVLALEQDEEPRSKLAGADLATEVKPQLEEAALGRLEPGLVLGMSEPRRQVELFPLAGGPRRRSYGSAGHHSDGRR